MKRLAGAFIVVCLAVGCAYASDQGSIPAAQQPVVKEITGKGDIVLLPAKYPNFLPVEGNVDPRTDPGCQHADSPVFRALRWPQPITTASPSTGKALLADASKLGLQPTDLQMTLTSSEIPEAYRRTAKILVTWTVRLEGDCYEWGIGHSICEPWIGAFSMNCPGGDVDTHLTVNDKPGPPVTMAIPSAETKGPVMQRDPTLTGTSVIKASDFPDNQIPLPLTLRIYWENKTSMRITSPDKMRNMIVNVIPYSRQDK